MWPISDFMIAVAAASFVLNIFGIFINDVSTFYSPRARFWELLTGSLLAWHRPHGMDEISALQRKVVERLGKLSSTRTRDDLGATVCDVQSCSGACLIAFALLFLIKAHPFP